jgi:hypothetical protein
VNKTRNLKERRIKMSCSNCKFSAKSEEDKPVFECRFNPPVIICSPGSSNIHGVFPVVREDMWCSHYDGISKAQAQLAFNSKQ